MNIIHYLYPFPQQKMQTLAVLTWKPVPLQWGATQFEHGACGAGECGNQQQVGNGFSIHGRSPYGFQKQFLFADLL